MLIRAASTHSARPSPIQPTPPMSVTTLETDAYWTSNYSSAVSTRPINSTAASSTINAMRDVCAASVSVEPLRQCVVSIQRHQLLITRCSPIGYPIRRCGRDGSQNSRAAEPDTAQSLGYCYGGGVLTCARTLTYAAQTRALTVTHRQRNGISTMGVLHSDDTYKSIDSTTPFSNIRSRSSAQRERERETICQQKILRLAQKLRVIDIRQRTA